MIFPLAMCCVLRSFNTIDRLKMLNLNGKLFSIKPGKSSLLLCLLR